MPRYEPSLAPETINNEQEDAPTADEVSADALGLDRHAGEETEHGGRPDPAQIMPDDVPDLVDTMDQMVSSGHIDMGAFAGEPRHDDEDQGEADEEEENDVLAEDDDEGASGL